jgi:hypothetical protein
MAPQDRKAPRSHREGRLRSERRRLLAFSIHRPNSGEDSYFGFPVGAGTASLADLTAVRALAERDFERLDATYIPAQIPVAPVPGGIYTAVTDEATAPTSRWSPAVGTRISWDCPAPRFPWTPGSLSSTSGPIHC